MKDDGERRQRAAHNREQAERLVAQINAEMHQRIALLRCDQCPEPKKQHLRELSLANGIRLWLSCHHCQAPGSECTAQVHAHISSEQPAVANRIVDWLVKQPALKLIGVSSLACGHQDVNRLILTFRVPVLEQVAAAVGAIPVEEFRN